MELRNAVQSRRSIRSFLKDPIPEQLVNEIIFEARWAQSWGNTQPWEVKVICGDPLERFKNRNTEAFLSGNKPNPDIPMPVPEKWPDLLRDRYNDVGRSVLDALSISRDDHGARAAYYAQMYSFFYAPALMLITMERNLPQAYAMLDVGCFLQTFCLSAHDRGLGVCVLGAAVRFPNIARELFSIPESKVVVIGAGLGRPDHKAPVNRFERKREDLQEFVQWLK